MEIVWILMNNDSPHVTQLARLFSDLISLGLLVFTWIEMNVFIIYTQFFILSNGVFLNSKLRMVVNSFSLLSVHMHIDLLCLSK